MDSNLFSLLGIKKPIFSPRLFTFVACIAVVATMQRLQKNCRTIDRNHSSPLSQLSFCMSSVITEMQITMLHSLEHAVCRNPSGNRLVEVVSRAS